VKATNGQNNIKKHMNRDYDICQTEAFATKPILGGGGCFLFDPSALDFIIESILTV